MQTDSHHSLWQQEDKIPLTSLSSDMETDVCIVGAGISGLSVAYQLLKKNFKVIVLDRKSLNDNETGLTSAHLSNALDDGFERLKSLHGRRGLQLAYESHSRAIDEIENIVRAEQIDCDFKRVDGYLFLDPSKHLSHLQRELTFIREAGGFEVELLKNVPLLNVGPCLKFPRQAQFHPVKYINGLVKAIQKMGGQIFTHTTVTEVKGGEQALVTTDDSCVVKAKDVVVATNVPVNNTVTTHTRLIAYRSYIIAVEIPPGHVMPYLLWDTADPYHYVRKFQLPQGRDVLIVGGADHRTGQEKDPESHFQQLKDWVKNTLRIDPVLVSQWSGQIIEPVDALAVIGRNPGDEPNVYISAGDSGHGLTHGTIAGMLLSDMISGRKNDWQTLYDPNRFTWRSQGTYLSENINTAVQYLDWLSPGELVSEAELSFNHGAVFRNGLRKVAVYRDEEGCVHRFSAECPHLKGIVHWNDSEKTWDCPCHGSRFDRYGKVINGPAIGDLPHHHEPLGTPLPEPVRGTAADFPRGYDVLPNM